MLLQSLDLVHFDDHHVGRIAQLVEQLTLNQRVLGSNPSASTIFLNVAHHGSAHGLSGRFDPIEFDGAEGLWQFLFSNRGEDAFCITLHQQR